MGFACIGGRVESSLEVGQARVGNSQQTPRASVFGGEDASAMRLEAEITSRVPGVKK